MSLQKEVYNMEEYLEIVEAAAILLMLKYSNSHLREDQPSKESSSEKDPPPPPMCHLDEPKDTSSPREPSSIANPTPTIVLLPDGGCIIKRSSRQQTEDNQRSNLVEKHLKEQNRCLKEKSANPRVLKPLNTNKSTSDKRSEADNKSQREESKPLINMVPIGDGYARVPRGLLERINWRSHTSATRKLLTAVFSRKTLATHSLTGKRSPAFPDKPAKRKLDPAKINDVVQTVVENCRVPESLVRVSITTKCADECKMLRNRKKKNSRRVLVQQENMPRVRAGREI